MTCEVCGNDDETIIHALRDCTGTKKVWTELGISSTNNAFYDLPLLDWMKSNCSLDQSYSRPHIPWKMLFPQALWLIWLQRNKVIFCDGSFDPNVAGHHYVRKGAEFFAIVLENPKKPRKVLAQVTWIKPQVGWVKLNSDGSVLGNPKKADGGVVLRCSNGDWIAGCLRKLGNTSCILAELWALKDGLLLAKQLSLENICVDMDVEFLVYLLSNSSVVNLSPEPLLSDCRNLMKTFLNCIVAHVYREANRCADRLARLGADLHSDHLILYNPPPVVKDFLASDKAGYVCNRLVVL